MQVLRLHGHTVIERPQMLFKSCLSRFGTRLSGLLVKKLSLNFSMGRGFVLLLWMAVNLKLRVLAAIWFDALIQQYVASLNVIHKRLWSILLDCALLTLDGMWLDIFEYFTQLIMLASRNNQQLASHCSPEIMKHVYQVPHFQTQSELDDFISFCQVSSNKHLRGLCLVL